MGMFYYNSPIGILEIIIEENTLISLKITGEVNFSGVENSFVNNIKKQLDEYFCGRRKVFDIQVAPRGTKFQKLIWNELLKIDYGKTKSYSEIAHNIGQQYAQRAVGDACSKNPIIIIIPCHRVVSKNGNLTGYAYGINTKKQLLDLEEFYNV